MRGLQRCDRPNATDRLQTVAGIGLLRRLRRIGAAVATSS
jgi:hypothetical protein